MYKETKFRSAIKTVSWRATGTLDTIIISFLITGRIDAALAIGGIEVFTKIILYFFHERVWDKIKFGRHEVKPAVIWLTGLVRSGKSEIAARVVKDLKERGYKAVHLDGHTIRHLIHENDFSRHEVNNHIKKVGYLAHTLEENGIFVVASFLSPFRESREFVKNLCNNFEEIYISTPVSVCEARDTSGIYERARKGEIRNFPGIDIPYEPPTNGVFEIDTEKMGIEKASSEILARIRNYL